MSDRRWPKAIGLVLAAGLLLAACGGSNTSSGGTKKYVVGISNTLTGNGFREEMICSIKAQAKASGVVSKIITANRTTDPSGQIADVRNLISAGVNVIVMNPSDRSALDAVIKEASAKGIVVVTVDQGVTSPDAYQLYNNQVKYAQLGADWLFKQLGGKGNVIEMRGINGVSADADRHQGFTQTLTKYSSIDSTVVDGYTTAKKPYVPTIGADNDGFIGQLINLKSQGLAGAAVTNPPTVGGAGLALGLAVLQGKTEPHLVNLDPQIWDNVSSTGLSTLQTHYDSTLNAYYSVSYQVDPWTTYTKADLLACADI